MDDIPREDLTYDDLSKVCEIYGGLMIQHVKIYIMLAWLGWTIYHVTI